ncbi:TPR-like protein [Backusella circina FSU 941]|nr:TPR-like protein [Backusella circina FSU 941]
MFAIRRIVTQRTITRLSTVPKAIPRVWVQPTQVMTRSFHVAQPRFDRISDAEEQIKLGTDYLNKGSIDMAMNSYHKSVRIAPSGAGYFNIGVCYFQMGKHKDAIKSFERSLEFTPNSADAHTNIASAYLMLRDTDNAIKHLEQASNFNPLDGEVQYNLACVYEATDRLDDAKTRFERASMAGIERAEAALEKLEKKMQ